MKRLLLLLALLLVPVLLAAWHYGPGQPELARDHAADLIARAEAKEHAEQWRDAMDLYAQAQQALPEGSAAAAAQLELRRAKARIRLGELPEAMNDMEVLLAASQADPAVPDSVSRDVRNELATANYYAAWIMRLEGASKEEWSVATDAARQHFRRLAEMAQADGSAAQPERENLEATVRLARMDLEELKGKKLPKQCCNCKNVSQKCRSQRLAKCQGKSKSQDVRKEINQSKGAGTGERTGSGS